MAALQPRQPAAVCRHMDKGRFEGVRQEGVKIRDTSTRGEDSRSAAFRTAPGAIDTAARGADAAAWPRNFARRRARLPCSRNEARCTHATCLLDEGLACFCAGISRSCAAHKCSFTITDLTACWSFC